MSFFSRIFGLCKTKPPTDGGSWKMTDGRVQVELSRTPELNSPGGAIRLEGRGLENRLLLLRGEDHHLHAFVNKCTHAGRRIDPLAGQEQIECCSVGKSTFDYEGRLISGSAKKPLTPLKVEEVEGLAVIKL
jgi:nitrite reductase/ring-hydroxylating ferredoxin subunit